MPVTFSVFTKPWKMPLPELARYVASLGFNGIELPVRPGYQVVPERITLDLPEAVRIMADSGVKITSIATEPNETAITACAANGIPVIRTMAPIGPDGYMATEVRTRQTYDALVPLLEHYGITLGVQNHSHTYVSNAMGLRHLIESYDPRWIAAIWDAGHTALNGEDPELAIDIVWSHLCMVNLKNAYWRRMNGPEAEVAHWEAYWTSGRQGLASWPRVAAELQRRQYSGVVCLPAEYTDEPAVDRLIAQDIVFARSLWD